MPKVTCCSLNVESGPHLQILADAGFDVVFPPAGVNLYQEEHLISVLADSDAVVAGSEPYTRKVLTSLPKLRVIARRGVGYDAIDCAAADECDVVVATTPGVLDESVAEHTMAMLLAVARGFPRLDQQVRAGNWERRMMPRVAGKTLGIVGLGRIGQAVARKGRALGLNLLAYDPVRNNAFAQEWNVEYTSLHDLLKRSEFVSLHLNPTPETVNMINRETLAMMKPGAVLINTGRGQLVDEDALCEALASGHLLGAGLDVFQQEPLPTSSPLLKFDNVLVSGHLAGLDIECNHDIAVRFAETIVSLYSGGWPQDCIRNLPGRTDWKWQKTAR